MSGSSSPETPSTKGETGTRKLCLSGRFGSDPVCCDKIDQFSEDIRVRVPRGLPIENVLRRQLEMKTAFRQS